MSANVPERRSTASGKASLFNFVLGIWVMSSPFALGYGYAKNAIWNNVICGGIIINIAAVRVWGGRSYRISWINFVAGVWLIVSPWTVSFLVGPVFVWNQVIVGVVIAILSAIATVEPTSGS